MAPRRMVVIFGGWVAALAVLAFAIPAITTAVFAILGLSSSASITYGVRRYRPSRSSSWFAMAAVPALAAACGVLYTLLPGQVGDLKPYLWAVLLLRSAIFVFALIGLVGMARYPEQAPERVRVSRTDTAILVFGAGLLVAIVVVLPFVFEPELPGFVGAVRAVYAVTDLVVLVAVFNLVTVVRWSVPVALLVGGWLALLCGDAVYLLGGTDAAWPQRTAWDLGWILFGGALGVAALLPGMADFRTLDRAGFSAAPIRLASVAGASLVVLALLRTQSVRPSWYVLVFTGAFAIMLGVVLTRLVLVTLELRRQVSGERGLREAVMQLVAAGDPGAVMAVVERVVPTLLPAGDIERVEVRRAGEPLRTAVIGPPGGVGERAGRISIPLGMTDGPDQPVMYVEGDSSSLAALRPRLEVLASLAAVSLDRIRLGQEVTWRAKEEYFHALVRTAADAVLMVDDDDRVSLASPSAKTVLGRSRLQGTWLPGLVDESQREAVEQVLAQARHGEALPPGMAVWLQGDDRSSPAALTETGSGWADGVHWVVPHDDGSTTLVEVACHRVSDEPSISGVVVNLQDVTERHRLKQELTENAVRDRLTGLPTELAVRELTGQAVERLVGSRCVVGEIHIDFDDFSLVNDLYGYEVGDTVLRTLGNRLTEATASGGTAARLEGDAFAILIEKAPSPAAVDEFARQVASRLARPVPVDGGTVACTASIGVATADDGGNVHDLVRQAEFALHAAKRMGKGHIRHYDPSMHNEAKERLELQSALEHALDDDALSLHYQPIVALDTGLTAGFEALLRWRHATLGWVSPELMVDIAEKSGLIEPIGEWVLTTALSQLADWDRVSPDTAPHVGVNVSSQQFRSSGFIRRIGGHLTASGLTPGRLHLEITESLLLPDDRQVWDDLQQLRRQGIRIAIDDFGKGYSALSYLRRVPLDLVKLDRLFVSSMTASTRQYELVKGIVQMAKTLNLNVVAEGIETEAERDLATRAGCALGQGFFYSRPLPGDQVPGWLAQERDSVAVQARLGGTQPFSV